MVTCDSDLRPAATHAVTKGFVMVELRRRAFLLEPGESLLLARSPLELALRYGMWARFTQLPPHQIVSNPLVATPLLNYPPDGHPARVWQQVNPTSLWHPLMWLPGRLAGRYQIQSPDGTTIPEDDDTWAVRLCLELAASGLYDTESGTWLDVLARRGLDINDPEALERVRRWQSGDDDAVLDTIDLSDDVDVTDRHWALETSIAILGDLRPASWALLANDLLATIDDIADPGNPQLDTDPTVTHQAAGTVVTLGRTMLAADGAGLGAAFWDQQFAFLDGIAADDYATVLDGPIAAISTALYDVRDANWWHLDALEDLGREPEQVPVH